MKEIYRLHEKATALLELCKEFEDKIIMHKNSTRLYKDFEKIKSKEEHNLDISERALKRLKYSYMKVLMQIAEL